jgi:hypothetical protein
MNLRHAWTFTGAAVLSCAVAFAQSTQPASPQPAGQTGDEDETPISLVGCLQREADYRRAHDLGRGGVAATGLGRGNEYVLINASRMDSSGTAQPASANCSPDATAEAYELTGSREPDLERFVGQVVHINGMLKEADIQTVGTTGAASSPEGGFDPLGQDLRLFEVEITSVQAAAQAPSSPAPAAPAAADTQPIGTTGAEAQVAQAELPRTASPLPVAGLLALLSFGGAFGIRALRRR